MNRAKIIELAIAEVGYKETGVNITKFGERFGLQGPWCGMFISIICLDASFPLPALGWPKGFCSVPAALKAWISSKTDDPKPADLVIFDWEKGTPKEGAADHVGFFLGWLDWDAGLFITAEGNIQNEAKVCIRNTKHVAAFLNISTLKNT